MTFYPLFTPTDKKSQEFTDMGLFNRKQRLLVTFKSAALAETYQSARYGFTPEAALGTALSILQIVRLGDMRGETFATFKEMADDDVKCTHLFDIRKGSPAGDAANEYGAVNPLKMTIDGASLKEVEASAAHFGWTEQETVAKAMALMRIAREAHERGEFFGTTKRTSKEGKGGPTAAYHYR